MSRQETAGTIINRAAAEVGLAQETDPFASTNDAFTQMTALLNSAGQELCKLFDWPELTKTYEFNTTDDVTSGYAALPTDYDRFINQTGWDLSNDVAIIGPLSAQDWAYLKGRDLATNTIYVSFRINQGQIEVYPNPPPADVDCYFQYITRNWAKQADETGIDYCTATSDVVEIDPTLMIKFLKVKFLDAKGLPSQAARADFENMLQNRRGSESGAKVLSAGRNSRGLHLLNPLYNTPDTNFGA